MAIQNVKISIHGGLDPSEARDLGLDPMEVLDFSASVNPLGAPSAVRRAVASVDISRYPEPHSDTLRVELARRCGVTPEHVLVGNGSVEIIHLIARAFLGPGRGAVVLGPTFSEYGAAAVAVGAPVRTVLAREADRFRWRLYEVMRTLAMARPRCVFVCSPNNPTGFAWSFGAVEEIARAAGRGSLLVLDEAYMPFADEPWASGPLLQLGNVLLLRSMTKDHGLAGVRLGYSLASPEVVDRLRGIQPSWSVNSVAQTAGLAALESPEHLRLARGVISEAKSFVLQALAEMGVPTTPSHANFVLAKVGNAGEVRGGLLRQGFCVRDCSSFGLPKHIRISMRPLEDCRGLVLGLERVLGHG